MPLFGRPAEAIDRRLRIRLQTSSIIVAHSQLELTVGMPLIGRPAEPVDRRANVPLHTGSVLVPESQEVLTLGMPLVGCFAEPVNRHLYVLIDPLLPVIETFPQLVLSCGIASTSRGAIPGEINSMAITGQMALDVSHKSREEPSTRRPLR